MARNRDAAQASRDRRKQYITELESKVRSLETLLSSSGGSNTDSPLAVLEESRNLKEENESLKSRLDIMAHESLELKRRLQTLESKFSSVAPSLSPSSPHSSIGSSVPDFSYPLFPTNSSSIGRFSSPDKDANRLVAREVKVSLQRKTSLKDWTSPFSHRPKVMVSDLRSSPKEDPEMDNNYGLPSPESVKEVSLGEPPGTVPDLRA
ncbi:hypothetical protein BT69DRAFT_320201 [Atractiella rhizophila]|nr:hypothetical protein BT69DRAFT_320201 [Atractiella rhizophila]